MDTELNIPYVLAEALIVVVAVIGNGLVMLVFHQQKHLQRKTNYYIVSLAIADFIFAFLGIPFTILYSFGKPSNAYACLGMVTLLFSVRSTAVYCLVAVSLDRYFAVVHPILYATKFNVTITKRIITSCWISGCTTGLFPLLGLRSVANADQKCILVDFIDFKYLIIQSFVSKVCPALILVLCYCCIYRVILSQAKTTDASDLAEKRRIRATRKISLIIFFFMICWIPLYSVNIINGFCNRCMMHLIGVCLFLSHLSSALNPILYAYNIEDFREALKQSVEKCFIKQQTKIDLTEDLTKVESL